MASFIDWYNENEDRSFPLSELATKISDAGDKLADNLIVDASIRFPILNDLNNLYISSIVNSAKLLSVTLLAYKSDTLGIGTFLPIGHVTVTKPIIPFIHYKVTPLYDGVGGWMVFGHGAETSEYFNHRYSSPSQSALLPRCAKGYFPLDIQYAKKATSVTQLTGIIKLLPGINTEIVYESRNIANIDRDCIVIKLKDTLSIEELQTFQPVCHASPLGLGCEFTPISRINNVSPDCDGNITIVFTGDLISRPFEDCSGIIIDTNFGSAETCGKDNHLPDSDGNLPDY